MVWLGGLLLIASFVFYVGLLLLKVLKAPWFLPIFGTLGAICLVAALTRKVTWGRVVGVIAAGVLAGWQWHFLLAFSRLPAYTGPATSGQPFPAFVAKRTDGSTFTQANLQGDKSTLLVFFRGRY
jgi:hypothetical protein